MNIFWRIRYYWHGPLYGSNSFHYGPNFLHYELMLKGFFSFKSARLIIWRDLRNFPKWVWYWKSTPMPT